MIEIEAPPMHLEWFTHEIRSDGSHICVIRPFPSKDESRVLTAQDSGLLQAILNEAAQDTDIPFGPVKQAVLRAFLQAADKRIAPAR